MVYSPCAVGGTSGAVDITSVGDGTNEAVGNMDADATDVTTGPSAALCSASSTKQGKYN